MIVLIGSYVSAQLYEEDFADGNTHLDWFPEWGGNNIDVISVVGNPSGDGWVGRLNNLSNGDTIPVGTVLAGAPDLDDYLMEAYIYCTVTAGPMPGPYQGIVARWDTTGPFSEATYYSLIVDFDGTERIRLASVVGSAPTALKEWFGDSIPGGVPTESGWHKLGLRLKSDSIWAYYDDVELSGSPFYDVLSSAGFFGIYLFSMVGVDSTLCDDILVSEVTSVEEQEDYRPASAFVHVHPNPFIDEVRIVSEIPEGLVALNIFDCEGRRVRTFSTDSSTKSALSWNGRFDSGEKAPPGVYFFRVTAGAFQGSGKLVYLR